MYCGLIHVNNYNNHYHDNNIHQSIDYVDIVNIQGFLNLSLKWIKKYIHSDDEFDTNLACQIIICTLAKMFAC